MFAQSKKQLFALCRIFRVAKRFCWARSAPTERRFLLRESSLRPSLCSGLARFPFAVGEPSLRLSLLRAKSLCPFGLVFSPRFGDFGELKKSPLLPAPPPALHRKFRAFALSPSLCAEPLHFATSQMLRCRVSAFASEPSSFVLVSSLASEPPR